VYLLVGLPGAGKYTIARALQSRLAAEGHTVRLVDNHYTCNPIFGLTAQDGSTALPAEVWDRVGEVREAVAQTIERLSPPDWTFIFTHVVDRPDDAEWVARLASIAADREARFVAVRVLCDVDELCRRIVTPSRRERMKSVSVDDVRRAYERGVPVLAEWNAVTVDVSKCAPDEAADMILRGRRDSTNL
jgi:thymidylate kinase